MAGTWQVTPAALAELRDRSAVVPASAVSGRRRAPWAERLEHRLVAGDARGSWSVIEASLAAGAELDEVYLDIVAPALRTIGRRWAEGTLDVAVEHRASVITGRLLGRLGPRFHRRGRSRGPSCSAHRPASTTRCPWPCWPTWSGVGGGTSPTWVPTPARSFARPQRPPSAADGRRVDQHAGVDAGRRGDHRRPPRRAQRVPILAGARRLTRRTPGRSGWMGAHGQPWWPCSTPERPAGRSRRRPLRLIPPGRRAGRPSSFTSADPVLGGRQRTERLGAALVGRTPVRYARAMHGRRQRQRPLEPWRPRQGLRSQPLVLARAGAPRPAATRVAPGARPAAGHGPRTHGPAPLRSPWPLARCTTRVLGGGHRPAGLGLAAAGELGVVLSQLLLVDVPPGRSGPPRWRRARRGRCRPLEVPPRCREADARRLQARLQDRASGGPGRGGGRSNRPGGGRLGPGLHGLGCGWAPAGPCLPVEVSVAGRRSGSAGSALAAGSRGRSAWRSPRPRRRRPSTRRPGAGGRRPLRPLDTSREVAS